jgi:hypothetical protein
MHVVMANARTIIRMFHIALISQRRIAYEHRKHDMGTKVDEDYDFEEGVHVLGLDDKGKA